MWMIAEGVLTGYVEKPRIFALAICAFLRSIAHGSTAHSYDRSRTDRRRIPTIDRARAKTSPVSGTIEQLAIDTIIIFAYCTEVI